MRSVIYSDSIGSAHITKYTVNLGIAPLITEPCIHAGENVKYDISSKYRRNVMRGENVKALAVVLYSEGVMSNDWIAAFFNAAANNEAGVSKGKVFMGSAENSLKKPERAFRHWKKSC